MNRRSFLTASTAVAGAAVLAGAAGPIPAFAQAPDRAVMTMVTEAADRQVDALMAQPLSPMGGPRGMLRQMRRLLTVQVWPQSRWHNDARLTAPILDLLGRVEAAQHDDGTFSAGNRHSPPDTAFLIEDMAVLIGVLEARPAADPTIAQRLAAMMRKAGPTLRTGGVHTPNHRWELSAALAKIDKVDPNPAYRARIDEWLSEGVDINAEGIYSERSSNYAHAVSNPSLLSLAHLPGLAHLRDAVRRNLETTIDLAEPTRGEVETVFSRRQDQDQRRQTLHGYYLQYRELALLDRNPRFAGVVRWIEQNDASQLGDALADLIEQPALAAPLPAATDPFVDLMRHFQTVDLVRHRRGPIAASFYAGSDWFEDGAPGPFYNAFGSGLATNPTLARMWRGGLAVEAVRIIPDFFNMGHFRPSEIVQEPGGVVRMTGTMLVPYYQPLPAGLRRPDGDYPLSRSVDGRFNSALDFSRRPADFRRLDLQVVAVPEPDGYRLQIEADGEQDVGVTVEITLTEGGRLEGGQAVPDGGHHLIDGSATYVMGDRRIAVGPGAGEGMIRTGAGEQYGWMGGRLQLAGTRLYVTGRTPMRHELRFTLT